MSCCGGRRATRTAAVWTVVYPDGRPATTHPSSEAAAKAQAAVPGAEVKPPPA